METKFTQGEWEIREDIPYSTGGFVVFCGRGDDNRTVARLPYGRMIPQPEDSGYLENKANAKLIAAAPELLNRLNAMTLSLMAHPDYLNGVEGDEWHDIVSLSIEAIKEATE